MVIYGATFDVDINLGYLKKTDNFLNENANLTVSREQLKLWNHPAAHGIMILIARSLLIN